MPEINVAWWNLENLFDHEEAERPSALARRLAGELEGWTISVRDRKLDQLAVIVQQMFAGAGPDLLGVCEVENEPLVRLLIERLDIADRDYQVIAHESPDARGIDVSFVVDANVLEVRQTGHQVVVRRNATRDIFWAELTVIETGAEFVAIANHWPSRSGGQYESEPFRILAGETVSFVLSSLFNQSDLGDNLPVLLMGDFNDEPYNRAMQDYLLSTRDADRVRRARSPRVFNLMWPLMAVPNPGTLRFSTTWNMLDQFLVSQGMLLSDSAIQVQPETTAIFRPQELQGTAGAPRRFGRPSAQRTFDRDGYSDHFPITVILEAKA